MSDLNGKAVIVTGASSGIGEACALLFASKGSNVTLSGRDSGRLQDAVEKCKAAAVQSGHPEAKFIAVSGDVTEAPVRDAVVEQTVQSFGKIDVVVVNHAVVAQGDTFEEVTEESFDTTINVNLKSAVFLIKRAVTHLEQSRGCVVCVSSIASQCVTRGGLFVYSISKAGLDHMMRSLALDLGPKGIRVNSVLPTYVRTRIFRDSVPDPAHLDFSDRLFEVSTPLKGPTSGPEEQAEVVVFLSSEAARFVSGECIAVDGAVLRRGNPFNYPESLAK